MVSPDEFQCHTQQEDCSANLISATSKTASVGPGIFGQVFGISVDSLRI